MAMLTNQNDFLEAMAEAAKSVSDYENYGAKKDSWFSHIAMEVPGEEGSTKWCEELTDEQYNQL